MEQNLDRIGSFLNSYFFHTEIFIYIKLYKYIMNKKICSQPILLSNSILLNEVVDLKNLPLPYILRDKTIMSPGIWKGFTYPADEVIKSFSTNDWSDMQTRSLIYEHEERADQFLGSIENPRLMGDEIIADLYIVDEDAARKLVYGAKFGISPKLDAENVNGTLFDYQYKNWSLVWNPAVKTTYLNSEKSEHEQEVLKMGEEVKPGLLSPETVELSKSVQSLGEGMLALSKTLENGFVSLNSKLDNVSQSLATKDKKEEEEKKKMMMENSEKLVKLEKEKERLEQELSEKVEAEPVRQTISSEATIEKKMSNHELSEEIMKMPMDERNKLFVAHLKGKQKGSFSEGLKHVLGK